MRRGFILLGLLALVWLTSCHDEHKKHEEETRFMVTRPMRMDTTITKDYVCQIRSVQHIEMRALERGYLEKIYVDEGQFVKKGQLMFQIMPRLYQAEYQKAQAEVEFAEIEYQNTKVLADSNIVSPNELALAKATYDKAKAELALAQVHLSFTEVRAPFDGIMDRFFVREGSLLDEGELLTTLSDNSQMWVYFNVPEAEYLNYMEAQEQDRPLEVKLLMANNKFFDHKGLVKTIEADFNNETGNIAFRATFPNPDGLLRHGETGSIIVPSPLENSLLIPQKATYEVLDRKYVFVIDENGKVTPRKITVGAELPHLYVVKDGVDESDKILLEGLRKVKAGETIKFDFHEPKSVLSELALYAE